MTSLNVGVLGHVDSGKTTLTKRIAELGSTCAFDKHADISGRRNTLDLGFSTLHIDCRRIALIDCPGHSQLIKAVLAASTVFDMAVVVVDVANGIQSQTAEHLLLCSIFCLTRIVLVLNKIDLVEEAKVEEASRRLRKGLKALGITQDCPIIPMSLVDGHFREEYLRNLLEAIKSLFFEPKRQNEKSFLMAVDHCFPIKGKGTVMTGTVLTGTLKLNQEFEIPYLKENRRPKSLESWKVHVNEVKSGERAAMIVQNIDVDGFSRCLVGSPGHLRPIKECICRVNPIQFFRSTLKNGTKMHISIGYETVMADCQFLRLDGDEYEQLQSMEPPCDALLTFTRPIFAAKNEDTVLMASKLDQNGKGCRFAFFGKILEIDNSNLRRFSRKRKEGIIERVENGSSVICTGMFKKETNPEIFRGMKVLTESGVTGTIEGPFGKSGKVRIRVENGKEKEKVVLFMKKYLNSGQVVSYIPSIN